MEPYLGASEFANHGERVVRGQRISIVASDIFLSWQRSRGLDGAEHDFYVRQLWDWKGSADLSTMSESGLHAYTRACGWSLARMHARSGDRLAIAAYLGGGPSFDRAIARFSAAYADQNERDYDRLVEAVGAGEVQCCSSASEGIRLHPTAAVGGPPLGGPPTPRCCGVQPLLFGFELEDRLEFPPSRGFEFAVVVDAFG